MDKEGEAVGQKQARGTLGLQQKLQIICRAASQTIYKARPKSIEGREGPRYIYLYIHICVCACVCVWGLFGWLCWHTAQHKSLAQKSSGPMPRKVHTLRIPFTFSNTLPLPTPFHTPHHSHSSPSFGIV